MAWLLRPPRRASCRLWQVRVVWGRCLGIEHGLWVVTCVAWGRLGLCLVAAWLGCGGVGWLTGTHGMGLVASPLCAPVVLSL